MLVKTFSRFAAAAAVCAGAAGLASAETVTLRSHDGAIALSGELLEFTGEAFVLRTTIGDMRINAMQVSCDGPGCPDPALLSSEFVVAGSDTIGSSLMPALLLGYADSLDADLVQARAAEGDEMEMKILSPQGVDIASINLRNGGSAAAFSSLLSGDAQIGMSSRPIRDAELDEFRRLGMGDLSSPQNERVLALDGLVVIVAPSNPVDALSEEDIAEIFAGEIDNWSEVGGPDMPINVYVRDDESGARGIFESTIMRPLGLEFDAAARTYDSPDALADDVALDPGAIGFAGIANVRSAKALAIRTECGLLATPDAFGVKTEEYPLAQRLFLYTKGGVMPPHAARLLQFAESNEAQGVISDAGFVDQAVESRPINNMGMRFAMAFTDPSPEFNYGQMRELASELISAERLSATFRFNPGSSNLDNKAQLDVRRVVDYLRQPEMGEKEVLVVGFTDSVGRADLNRQLSFRRADQVREAIVNAAPAGALAGIDFRVLGYGELAPVGCNESLSGRRINRRVELWIRDKF